MLVRQWIHRCIYLSVLIKQYLDKINSENKPTPRGHVLLSVFSSFKGLGPFSSFSDLSCLLARTSQDPPGLPGPHTRHHCGSGWEQATPGRPDLWGPCSHCDLAEDHYKGTVDPSPMSPFVKWVHGASMVPTPPVHALQLAESVGRDTDWGCFARLPSRPNQTFLLLPPSFLPVLCPGEEGPSRSSP